MLDCQLLSCIIDIIVQFIIFLVSDFCSIFHLIILFDFISLFSFHVSPVKYSILIVDCIPGISIPLPVKHHHLSSQ